MTNKYSLPSGTREKVRIIEVRIIEVRLYFKTTSLVQKMAPLPEERVSPSPPFTHVGIDFLGPLYIKNEFQKAEKAYVCVFRRCVTRAVHLELTRSMTTERFLLALTRLMPRRGKIDVI